MHKLLKRIIIIFSMTFATPLMTEAQTTFSIEYENEDSDIDYEDIPVIGKRSISYKMTGYVDWEMQSIILPDEISESVISYELWVDNACLLQTVNESEFVAKLSNIKVQFVTIIITTQNHLLTGVYTPQN
ncbi:MAG: hypothetical protein K2K88_00295 [Muribaculaceae bacterium]|nr:hypothetical protein [Muribaculaceae bacterium]MDE5844198.1 hypothetical protein [Muribaculaceae bacterium]MDE5970368.1 hypothetical protein [Muribaculaceae bacterium]MDE6351571.1 hypothetical protein [Muribaculaceae bacterium]